MCSNCDLWSLQNRHFRKQENLSHLSPKEKSVLLLLLKIKLPLQKKFLKRCRSQTVIFDLSKSGIPENKSYFSSKEKRVSLVPLKIPFYVRYLIGENKTGHKINRVKLLVGENFSHLHIKLVTFPRLNFRF